MGADGGAERRIADVVNGEIPAGRPSRAGHTARLAWAPRERRRRLGEDGAGLVEGVARGGDPLPLSIGRFSTTAMGRFVSLSMSRR